MQDDYMNRILEERRSLTTTQVAGHYGITARKLNQILVESGVQRKEGRNWALCTQHQQKGLVSINEFPFMRSHGQRDHRITMRWTTVGRLFIHDLLLSQGYTVKVLAG